MCLETQNVRALKAQRNKTDKTDAHALLTRFTRKDKVKTWGLAIAKRTNRKATVAVARKLAVILYAMWTAAIRTGLKLLFQPVNLACGGAALFSRAVSDFLAVHR